MSNLLEIARLIGKLEAKTEQRIDALEAENKALREALQDAQEGFDSASEGHGVDFYAYAADFKALLEGKADG